MQTTSNLKLAIEIIANIYGDNHEITSIEFKGESDTIFRYRLDKSTTWIDAHLTTAIKNAKVNGTYFTTLGRAIDYAIDTAKIRGYAVIESGILAEAVNYGQTRQYHFDLEKTGKLQRKQLHLSVYRLDSGKYELTHYIN